MQEALRILQASDSSSHRSPDADLFMQLATLKAILAGQDSELRAQLLVRQSTATRVNELRELVERSDYRRQRDFRRPSSPGAANSSRAHESTSGPTKEPDIPTSSSKKSLKEWKEGKEKEKSTKGHSSSAKPSEVAEEVSPSKSTGKRKASTSKSKIRAAKDSAPPSPEKPVSRPEGSKPKSKRRSAPKSKETVSTDEGEVEGELEPMEEGEERGDVDVTMPDLDADGEADQGSGASEMSDVQDDDTN